MTMPEKSSKTAMTFSTETEVVTWDNKIMMTNFVIWIWMAWKEMAIIARIADMMRMVSSTNHLR